MWNTNHNFITVLTRLQSLNHKGEKQRANYWVARMAIAANEKLYSSLPHGNDNLRRTGESLLAIFP